MVRKFNRFGNIGSALLACAVSAAMVFSPAFAFATPAETAQAEADAALAKLNEYQNKLDIASNDYYEAVYAKEAAQAKVTEADERITEATEQLEGYKERLSNRAVSSYRSGSLSAALSMVLSCTSFEEFANNVDFLNKMNEYDTNLLDQTRALTDEIKEQKAVYEEQTKVAEEQEAKAEEVMNEASALTEEMRSTYNSLSAEAAELLEQERAAEAAASAAAAAAAAEAIESGNTDSSSSDDSDDGDSYSGGSEPSYDASTGNAIVDRALAYVGNADYVWGACSPGAFDCSGFVSYCLTGRYSRLGTTYTFLGWDRVYDPQPGDVCVNSGHCGIYIGGGQMAHAATEGVGVIIGPVQSGMIYVRY